MPRDAGLRRDDDVISEVRAAREPDLAHHQAVPPDDDVVGDLHQVVQLDAALQQGRAQGAAVDAGVGLDLGTLCRGRKALFRLFLDNGLL